MIKIICAAALLISLTGCGGSSSSDTNPPPITSNSSSSIQFRANECALSPKTQIDPNAPVLTLKGPHVIHVPIGGTYTDEGATATDKEDGDLTSAIVTTGIDKIDTQKASDFLVRYRVTDKDNHAAKELFRVVRVHNDGDTVKYSRRPYANAFAPAGFVEHLPSFYGDDPKQLYPVIIFAHGWGHYVEQSPENDRLSTMFYGSNMYEAFDNAPWPQSRPFIMLEPQRCNAENVGLDEWALVDQFIDWAVTTYKVDPNRIYMTGLSAGGYFTYRYPVLYPNKIAAIVPMSAGGPVENETAITSFCTAMEKMPIWAFHGDADATVPLTHSTYTFEILRTKCKKPPTPAALFTIIPNGNHVIANEVWTDIYLGRSRFDSDPYNTSIYDWFLQYSLDKAQ